MNISHWLKENRFASFTIVPALLIYVALWGIVLAASLLTRELIPGENAFHTVAVVSGLLTHYVVIAATVAIMAHLILGIFWRQSIKLNLSSRLMIGTILAVPFSWLLTVFTPNFYDLVTAPGSYWYVIGSESAVAQPVKRFPLNEFRTLPVGTSRVEVLKKFGPPTQSLPHDLFYVLALRGGSGWVANVHLDAQEAVADSRIYAED